MHKFYVWSEERGESLETAELFEAVSPVFAAQKWALEYDAKNDSPIAGDERVFSVFVQHESRKDRWEFLVSGCYLPSYSVRLKVSHGQEKSLVAALP